MSRLPGLPITLLLAAVLALAACGGDSDAEGGPEARDTATSGGSSGDDGDADDNDSDDSDVFDVCGLLGPADLEAVFDSTFEVGRATHLDQTGGDQCIWSNTDAPPVKQFSIVVMREGHLSDGFEGAGVNVESLYNDTKELMCEVEELDLGDDAYLVGSQISVLDGDMSYDFSTVLGTSEQAISGLRKLAEQVVG